MSGKDEAMQQHLADAGATKFIYFSCFGSGKSVVMVTAARDILKTINSVYIYMEGSPKSHAVYEKKLTEVGIVAGKTAFHTFSDTQWTSKSNNLDAIINTLPADIKILTEM